MTASWRPLVVLALAQFLMVLDSAVMNVSVSRLVEDFDTEVTSVQAVITLYSLVMAAFMVTGGKLGDRFGRRRVFRIGLAVYGCGSLLTAAAGSIPVLIGGWSVLEGLGAALVLPALAALVGGTYEDRQRVFAYGILGGAAGAGVAVGPILGGLVTTNLSWRWVFVGEAVIVVGLVAVSSWLVEPERRTRPTIDLVGTALSSAGLGLVVLAVLQSSTWGWLEPRRSPVEPLGFALTPFAAAAGVALLWLFVIRQRHVESRGGDPLVRLALLGVRPLRAGLAMFTVQNLVLLGLFFTIPLYLQLTQGLDALETGLRLLPVSVTMLVVSMSGSLLLRVASPRLIVRTGLVVVAAAGLVLVATIRPELDGGRFAVAMAVLGVGVGLLASQLGNVVQAAVGEDARGEAGGLQYTAMNLGAALGTAFAGAVLVGGLTTAFVDNVSSDELVAPLVETEAVATRLRAGLPFVDAAEVERALASSELPRDAADAIVTAYEDAQLRGLQVAILAVSGIALGGLLFSGGLPGRGAGHRHRRRVGEPAAPEQRGPIRVV